MNVADVIVFVALILETLDDLLALHFLLQVTAEFLQQVGLWRNLLCLPHWLFIDIVLRLLGECLKRFGKAC